MLLDKLTLAVFRAADCLHIEAERSRDGSTSCGLWASTDAFDGQRVTLAVDNETVTLISPWLRAELLDSYSLHSLQCETFTRALRVGDELRFTASYVALGFPERVGYRLSLLATVQRGQRLDAWVLSDCVYIGRVHGLPVRDLGAV